MASQERVGYFMYNIHFFMEEIDIGKVKLSSIFPVWLLECHIHLLSGDCYF
jgi:hypothetical protein